MNVRSDAQFTQGMGMTLSIIILQTWFQRKIIIDYLFLIFIQLN